MAQAGTMTTPAHRHRPGGASPMSFMGGHPHRLLCAGVREHDHLTRLPGQGRQQAVAQPSKNHQN